MNTFVVKRFYGKSNSDYLYAWDKEWGTACMGSINNAMKFDNLEDAKMAALKATSRCIGFDGQLAQGVTFKAVTIQTTEIISE
jgi:hypothetical protein